MSRDHDLHYTSEVRGRMSASARASWQRRKASGYVSQRDQRKAAPELYRALKGMVSWFDCQRGVAPLESARKALAKAEGR